MPEAAAQNIKQNAQMMMFRQFVKINNQPRGRCVWTRRAYLASRARAKTPAASGAAADVPE